MNSKTGFLMLDIKVIDLIKTVPTWYVCIFHKEDNTIARDYDIIVTSDLEKNILSYGGYLWSKYYKHDLLYVEEFSSKKDAGNARNRLNSMNPNFIKQMKNDWPFYVRTSSHERDKEEVCDNLCTKYRKWDYATVLKYSDSGLIIKMLNGEIRNNQYHPTKDSAWWIRPASKYEFEANS